MFSRQLPLASLLLAVTVAAQAGPVKAPVEPSLVTTCAAANLDGITATNFACVGFAEGNLLNTKNASIETTAYLLGLLGLARYDGSWTEKIELGGGSNVNFSTVLSGTTYVGIHTGASNGGASGTAFYRFDAGDNLDTFRFLLSGSSGAVLFSTEQPPLSQIDAGGSVPEPQTLSLLAAGLAAVGLISRRRRAAR